MVYRDTTHLYDRVLGSLLAGAAGDAMGGTTEMMHYETIERLHGWVDSMVPRGSTLETARFTPGEDSGVYTDDTRLRNILCRSIIETRGRVSADVFGLSWERLMDGWFYTPVVNSYYKIASGTRPRHAGRGNMASNSSAMSMYPLGLISPANPREAARDAYDVCSVIHDSYALDGAVAVIAATSEAVRKGTTVDAVVEAGISYLDHGATEMRDSIERAVDLARRSGDYKEFRREFYASCTYDWPQNDLGTSMPPPGFYDTAEPREAVPTVFGLFVLSEGTVVKGLPYAANFGRDADTIGSMLGGICGAYVGASSIPEAWVADIGEANDFSHADTARSLTDIAIEELARSETIMEDVLG